MNNSCGPTRRGAFPEAFSHCCREFLLARCPPCECPGKLTGRFNFAQGLVALATGLGSGLSNLLAGFIVQEYGFTAGFLSLAVIALGGLGLFALGMPETRPADEAPGARLAPL